MNRMAIFYCMTFSIQLSNGSKNCFNNVTKKLTKNEIATKYSRAFSRGSGKHNSFYIPIFSENGHFLRENSYMPVITVFILKKQTLLRCIITSTYYLPKLHSQ